MTTVSFHGLFSNSVMVGRKGILSPIGHLFRDKLGGKLSGIAAPSLTSLSTKGCSGRRLLVPWAGFFREGQWWDQHATCGTSVWKTPISL